MPEEKDLLLEHCYNNLQRYKLFYHEFRQIFKVSLKEFWMGNLIGFDLIKFDEEFLQTKEGCSMSEVIKEKYGERAETVIKLLADITEPKT